MKITDQFAALASAYSNLSLCHLSQKEDSAWKCMERLV